METPLINKVPLLLYPSSSKPLSSFSFAGARRFGSLSSSSSSSPSFFVSGGGGGGLFPGGRRGGSAAALSETADAGSDFISLHVGGMMCDGCAASVKRILESQPEVTSAVVDFEKATAIVWTAPEIKVTEDWQKQFGVKLANHLGTCGFESHLQGQGEAKQN